MKVRPQNGTFLREMDIVNGFQLCDAEYRGSCTRGSFFSFIRI